MEEQGSSVAGVVEGVRKLCKSFAIGVSGRGQVVAKEQGGAVANGRPAPIETQVEVLDDALKMLVATRRQVKEVADKLEGISALPHVVRNLRRADTLTLSNAHLDIVTAAEALESVRPA